MELVLGTWHKITADCKKYELIHEWLLQVYLNVLIREYALALNEECTHLWLSYDIPPVLAVLNNILNHLIVITLKFVILLIGE